jgi:predicted nucleic acid-binding protein
MKRLLIDTNVYSEFKKGNEEVVEMLRRPDQVLVCVTVLGELLSGFSCGSRMEANVAELEAFLDRARVRFVGAGATTAEFYSEVYSTLRRKGKPIPTNDMWIGATALEHGARLYSLDAHFEEIDGLLLAPPV